MKGNRRKTAEVEKTKDATHLYRAEIGSLLREKPKPLVEFGLQNKLEHPWGAHVLVAKYHLVHRWRHLLISVVPVTLVMTQPNLSVTITLGIIMLGLLWFAGMPARLFAALPLGAAAGLTVVALSADCWLGADPFVLLGVVGHKLRLAPDNPSIVRARRRRSVRPGLGRGSANWGYLPGVENDFIFALIGEELGFIGCIAVIALHAGVAVVGRRIARRNLDPGIRIVAGTLTLLVVAQAAINIGYVVGLLPVTGVTLPLISYGGTSLLVSMLLFGILANCARNEPQTVSALRLLGPGRFGPLLHLPAPPPYSPRRVPRRADRPVPRARRTPRPRQATGRRLLPHSPSVADQYLVNGPKKTIRIRVE